MLSEIFLGMALLGAEWVLYVLVLLSLLSITLIIERYRYYKEASKELETFRHTVRQGARTGEWKTVLLTAHKRAEKNQKVPPDFETGLTAAMVQHHIDGEESDPEVLSEIGQDAITRTRINWEKNLAILATIGNNAPFIGLFGTVLGIIQAFHALSQKGAASAGVHTVSAGISDALIATAVGILVAIPAVAAFNLFSRKVKSALGEADALRSFLVGKLSGKHQG